MRPTKEGGVVLEATEEIARSMHALLASKDDLGIGTATPEGHERMQALLEIITGRLKDQAETIELDNPQLLTLQEACGIATAHLFFSQGLSAGFHLVTRIPVQEVPAAMERWDDPLIRNAGAIIASATFAAPLLGILSNCISQPPTV